MNNISVCPEYKTVFLYCTLTLTRVLCLPIQVHHSQRWYTAYSACLYKALCLNFLGCHHVRKLCLCCASVWYHICERSWRTEWLSASCWGHRRAGCRSCCDSIQPSTFCGRLLCWEITSTTWVGVPQVIRLFSAWLVSRWSMQLSGNRISGLYLYYDNGYRKTVCYVIIRSDTALCIGSRFCQQNLWGTCWPAP
jgi:hypothetical protein